MIPKTALYESWNPIEVICNGEIVQLIRAARAIVPILSARRKLPAAILYIKIIVAALTTEGEHPDSIIYPPMNASAAAFLINFP